MLLGMPRSILYNKLTVVFEPSSISVSIESMIIITDKLCIYTYYRYFTNESKLPATVTAE